MTAPDKTRITDATKLSELTVGEFKAMMRDLVQDIVDLAVLELEQQLPDPDAGKKFKREFAEQLRQSMQEHGQLKTLEEVKRELGFDEKAT